MEKFRFAIALYYYKFILFIEKISGRYNNLYPGLTKIAFQICPDFLKLIGKPKQIIAISGTNGKTSTCGVIKSILEKDGYTVINNTEWSMPIGIAHTFAKNVNFRNLCNIDYAVIEVDELKSIDILRDMKPNYMIITNLFRDSLKRNAYPMHIFHTLDTALKSCPKTNLILNADDPISSFIREGNVNNFYYSIKSDNNEEINYNAFDFAVCPKCMSKIEYDYRHYLNLGKVHCTHCSFKSKDANLVCEFPDLKKQEIVINENKKKDTYPLLSKSLFNSFNTVAIITLLRVMDYTKTEIKELISSVSIPASRENVTKVKNVTIYNQMAKGQNVSATSSVFKYMSTIDEDIEIVLLLDEAESKIDPMETITWLYDTDFEFLNSKHIKRIIVGSKICDDYIPRLLMANIPQDRFICVPEEEIQNNIDYKNYNKIYILFDSDAVTKANELRDNLVDVIKEGDK